MPLQVKQLFELIYDTMKLMKHVILIPGLGNWGVLYWLTAPWWWIKGYTVSVFSMDWQMNDDVFEPNYEQLLKKIHDKKKVFIVGASAGGVAALLALVDGSKHVQKIAIIASPVTYVTGTKNLSLAAAFRKLKRTSTHNVARRVISIYGTQDALVKVQQSQLPGAMHVQIQTGSHGRTIIVGLTSCSRKIHHFFGE